MICDLFNQPVKWLCEFEYSIGTLIQVSDNPDVIHIIARRSSVDFTIKVIFIRSAYNCKT